MSKFTHYKAAIKSAFYSNQKLLKNKLGIRGRPRSRVAHSGIDHAIERYTRVSRTLLQYIPNPEALKGSVASEIGCGDCYASADMMLGLGARHVHLVEFQALELTEDDRQTLHAIAANADLPNKGELFALDEPLRLNPQKATYHQGLLENIRLPEKVDFLYSFDVLEHVEDLDGFFAYCGEVVRPGGLMVHKFDLSGHGLFEDPMPPLDFMTFPRWLFNIIFPKYMRAAGHFADEFFASMEKHGFTDLKIVPIRVAEPGYLNEIWPHLMAEARKRDKEIVKLLDLVVIATRKA
jgi:SAM-dependent methyltransferase